MIPPEVVQEIIETAKIEEVVGDYVALKKRGVNLLGNCPFHQEKSPSFTVSPTKNIYKCFGCGKAGNSVGFIMDHEQFTYPEALKHLAKKYNIEVEEEELTEEQVQSMNEKESMMLVVQFATQFFSKQLNETDEGKAIGLSYFTERGFSADTINKFELGYSPEKWDALTVAAQENQYKTPFLISSGLTIEKNNKYFDRFRNRVIFPIHNLSGKTIGFGGRILGSQQKGAKYLNSPESKIYNKSKVLYGLYQSKKGIAQQDNCFLVEGYTDVISLHQAGVENVVSSSGTSLTNEQIQLIKRYTPNITILFDGDAAGIKAAFRGIDMILSADMNVRVVLFPEGEDPDSYALTHTTDEINEFLSSAAKDFIQFKTDLLLKESANDPLKKASLIHEIVSSIAQIPDPIKRTIYAQSCSSLLSVDEQLIIDETNKQLRKKAKKLFKSESSPIERDLPTKQISPKKNNTELTERMHYEKDLVRLLLNYGDKEIILDINSDDPEKKEQISISMSDFILHEIHQDELLFSDPQCQQILNFIIATKNEDTPFNLQQLTHHPDQTISQFVIDIIAIPYELSNWEKHNIFVTTEAEQLKKAAINTMYSFKLSIINCQLKEFKESLNSIQNNDEVLMEMLTKITTLENIKSQLSKKLGRIILK